MGTLSSLWDSLRNMAVGSSASTLTTPEDLKTVNARRISKYSANWDTYWGVTLALQRSEDNAPASRVNFLKRNIDKIIYFAFGLGYSASHPRYQQQLDLIDTCWGTNKIEKLTRVGQQGSVTGDAFIMCAPRAFVNKAISKAEGVEEDVGKTPPSQLRIVSIPSQFCTAYYDPFDIDDLEKLEIRIPYQVMDEDGNLTTHYNYMEITEETIKTGVLDSDMGILGIDVNDRSRVLKTQENPLKEVYVVHIRNYPAGSLIYGFDDVTEAGPLNSAYTERLTNIGDIVSYHAAPITCVYGAKAGNLVRGPNKVWGNLPKDAKVENLSMNTDLKAANDHLQKIKEGIHELTGVPEIAQGSQQAISNTSGVALHTMYLPLIERAGVKQEFYGPKFIEIGILALKWCQLLNLMQMVDPNTGDVVTVPKITKESQWEDMRLNTVLMFPSPLPKDELITVQVQSTRLAAKIQSRRAALVALGERNPDKVLAEIDEDDKKAMARQQELLEAQAKAKAAANPEKPGSADATGEKPVDGQGSSITSGAGANQGVQSTESGAPKGRPATG